MPQMPWNMLLKKQCERETGQDLLTDEKTLAAFSKDFGKLEHSAPFAVFAPQSCAAVEDFMEFCHAQGLGVTIRGHGMSQGGQSLAGPARVALSMASFPAGVHVKGESVVAEAGATWADVIRETLPTGQIPAVIPYNCGLSVPGVLSAGGVGAAAFRHGVISRQVTELELVLAQGERVVVDSASPLFHAVLSGQGRVAVITRATLKLRPCKTDVQTFFLVFHTVEAWLAAYDAVRESADYIEMFCSPAPQGARLVRGVRVPFASFVYGMQISVEFTGTPPAIETLGIRPNGALIHAQHEPLESWLHRHDVRFEAMRRSGQWDLWHPWYECFVSRQIVEELLGEILQELPLHYATLVHTVPISNPGQTGFFMLPEGEEVFALMILNPGLTEAQLPSCLAAIRYLDSLLLARGGKRYLSGCLGEKPDRKYWKIHFGPHYKHWMAARKTWDPKGQFGSVLYSEG